MDTLKRYREIIAGDAACKNTITAVKFVDRSTSKDWMVEIDNPHIPHADDHRAIPVARVAAAVKICSGCPVKTECREYALALPPMDGGIVMGGMFFPNINITKSVKKNRTALAVYKAKFIKACKKYNDRIAEQACKKGYAHLRKLRIPGPGLIRMGIINSNDPSVEMVGKIVQDLFLQVFDDITDKEAEKLSKTLQAARKKRQAEADAIATLDEWTDFTGEVNPMD